MTPAHQGISLACRACRASRQQSDLVLDLGEVPAADWFPQPTDPLPDPTYPLAMWCCRACGLAQLAEDPTNTSEPRGVEPEALRLQARQAVRCLTESGLLDHLAPATVTEFGSPHGGSWLHLLAESGLIEVPECSAAHIVVDCFGLMHERDQLEGISKRIQRLSADGILIVQFHSLEAIIKARQWNSLRHGHYAYFSLTALLALLAAVGLAPVRAWEFPLYGGTVLLAATRTTSSLFPKAGERPTDATVDVILNRESELGVTRHSTLRILQRSADAESRHLTEALRAASKQGRRIYAYGAASRAVILLSRAGVAPSTLTAVADASTAKQGRMLPGTRIPIISPAELVTAAPDQVLMLLPDLLPEVNEALPELAGRWRLPEDFEGYGWK